LPELNSPLSEQVEVLRAQSSVLNREDKQNERIPILLEAWELLPEPKGHWKESYHLANYLIDAHIKIRQLKEAQHWAKILFTCNLERPDHGQRELFAGKVEFELGNFEEAKRFFTIADFESKGRNFRNVELKYLKFYKQK
jgi:tetratricopeptide (TPR) repeat protein